MKVCRKVQIMIVKNCYEYIIVAIIVIKIAFCYSYISIKRYKKKPKTYKTL